MIFTLRAEVRKRVLGKIMLLSDKDNEDNNNFVGDAVAMTALMVYTDKCCN